MIDAANVAAQHRAFQSTSVFLKGFELQKSVLTGVWERRGLVTRNASVFPGEKQETRMCF